METKKISQTFFAALFLAALSMALFAGCASTGSGVSASLAKSSAPPPSNAGKIYSVTLESGEKRSMTEDEYKAQTAQNSKKRQPQAPAAPQKTGENVAKKLPVPTTPKKAEKEKPEKEGTSTRTYTEAEHTTALLRARADDKVDIAKLVRIKNDQAVKIRGLEGEKAQLAVQFQGLQAQVAGELESGAPPALPASNAQRMYPLTQAAVCIGYIALGLCALGVVCLVCIGCFKALFQWATWTALSLAGLAGWLTESGLIAAVVGVGLLLTVLMLRWLKQRKAGEEESTPTETPPVDAGAGTAGGLLKQKASLTPPAAGNSTPPQKGAKAHQLGKKGRKKKARKGKKN